MISNNYFWINIFFLAIGTLAIRGSIIFASQRISISERWKELFSFIPAAVLPALIAPAVFFHKGHAEWLFGKERMFALMLATVACYFSKNTFFTIVFGLISLYLFSHYL